MPNKSNQLFNELTDLRSVLREKLLDQHEKKTICTDEALTEMAKKRPLRLSDFLAIPGLDHDFLDRFAHLFLDVILRFVKLDIKPVKQSKHASVVLDRYKDRLTDISKTNPNLYAGKIEKIRSFDLVSAFDAEDLNLFLNMKKKTLTFDTSDEERFNHLTTLYRSINKDYKDLGTYHLYVAYPYVEGIYKKEMFPIKAPLAYMPVKLERQRKTYTLSIDTSKDLIFNRDLLLTLTKMEKSNLIVEQPELKDLSVHTVKDLLIPFYEKHGLSISATFNGYTPYRQELKEDFMKTAQTVFSLKPYVTFGRYMVYSSMIQKDMAEIIESHTYNELLEGLIDESNLYEEEKSLDLKPAETDVDESSIVYINDINFAQEKVIEMVEQEKKIVIWGPPGTGKSQTITSLIARQILKNENVLVVSEKKVALDVIYARLGHASHYAMMIDDASNKQAFYDKLHHMMHQKMPSRSLNNDIYRVEEDIKHLDQTFNEAIKLMYQTHKQGRPLAYFYERYLKDKDLIPDLSPKLIYEHMNQNIKHIDFDAIDVLGKIFDKDSKLKSYLNYHKVIKAYPWFNRLETKISRSSFLEFDQFILDFNDYVTRYQKAWFFKKRRLKKNFIQDHQMKLCFMTQKRSLDRTFLKTLLKDNSFATYVFQNLKDLNKIKTNYLQLSPLALSFLDLLSFDHLFKSVEHIETYRKYLFDGYITGFLETFRAKHQKYLFILDAYEKKMDELKNLGKEKLKVSQESFEMKLFSHALDLSNTKRIMDMRRILESDKKPSIKAFFDLFHVEMFSHVKIWLLTPEVISSILPLQFNLFDLVIFDEASQMYVEKGIPAIYRAKKVVIAGDPKQLRPSSLGMGRLDEDDPFEEDELLKQVTFDAKSLLDLARYKYKESLLNYHYRSHYQELIEFSNHAFYDGKLIISPNVKTPVEPPISYVYVKEGSFVKKRNMVEAKAVIELLKKVLKDKDETESVGIITFNSTQRDAIMNLVDEELFKKGVHQKRFEKEVFREDSHEDQSLFVKNIENVQGDERDIIIFSMGYAKDESGTIKRRFGWLNHEGGQNRLNVAITRAKKKIYFVSSLYPEELKVDDLSGKGPKLLKDFMRYCYFVSKKNHDLASEVLSSLYQKESDTRISMQSHMISDLKQRLTKAGYHVDEQIGIGQFKIHLAIFDELTSTYQLGIICDLVETNKPIARKELLHQEKFLESRGWKVTRIFHMNYYENPQKVLKDIKDRIKNAS